MKAYLLLLSVSYPVFCLRSISIPLKNFPREHNRMSAHNDQSRWKREDKENTKPVFIYDPATYGLIGVGSPVQPIPILFDTYSNVSWLFNTGCTSEICITTSLFDSSVSNSSKAWGAVHKYVYKNLNIYGRCTIDTFLLGQLTMDKFTFIDVRSSDWTNAVDRSNVETYAGEISLRIPSSVGDNGMLSNLLSNEVIDEMIFGLMLPSYNIFDMEGELTIGDFNRNFVNQSNIHWIYLISDLYWKFNIENMFYGKYGIMMSAPAIIDTGLSILVGPVIMVTNIFEHIRLSVNITPITITSFMTNYDGFAVRCKSSGLFYLDFIIDGKHYKLYPSDYLLPMDGKEGWCAFGIAMANSIKEIEWRLGDVFLSKYYTAFDVVNREYWTGRRQKTYVIPCET